MTSAFEKVKTQAYDKLIDRLRIEGAKNNHQILKDNLNFTRFRKGDILFTTEIENGKSILDNEIFFLIDGTVQIVTDGLIVSNLRRTGDIIGEFVLLYNEQSTWLPKFKALSINDVTTLSISPKTILKQNDEFVSFFHKLMTKSIFDKLLIISNSQKDVLKEFSELSIIDHTCDILEKTLELVYAYSEDSMKKVIEPARQDIYKIRIRITRLLEFLHDNAKAWSRGG